MSDSNDDLWDLKVWDGSRLLEIARDIPFEDFHTLSNLLDKYASTHVTVLGKPKHKSTEEVNW